MPWFRLDDKTDEHAKVAQLSPLAFAAWVKGGLYCARNLTDGHIHKRQALRIAAESLEYDTSPDAVFSELVSAGLWSRTDDGFCMHDYLDYNPSKEQVEKEREQAKERKERWKERKRNARKNAVPHSVPNGGKNGGRTPPPDPVPDPVPEANASSLRGLTPEEKVEGILAEALAPQSAADSDKLRAVAQTWVRKYSAGWDLAEAVRSLLADAEDSGKLQEWHGNLFHGVSGATTYLARAIGRMHGELKPADPEAEQRPHDPELLAAMLAEIAESERKRKERLK